MTTNPERASRSEPVIDPGTIEALEELGGSEEPGLLAELIDLFVEDARVRMQAIAACFESGDLDGVAKAAHALKSASATLGAFGLSDVCRRIELEAADGTDVERLVEESRDAHAAAESALLELRADLPGA